MPSAIDSAKEAEGGFVVVSQCILPIGIPTLPLFNVCAIIILFLPSFSMSSTIKFPIHPVFPPKTRTRFISVVLSFLLLASSSDMIAGNDDDW